MRTKHSHKLLLVAAIAFVSVLIGATLFSAAAPQREEQAFGSDIVTSPADVPEQDRIQDPLPSETAVKCQWYRSKFEDPGQVELYDNIEAAILGRRTRVAIPNLTSEQVGECFWAVIYDHPEFFWVNKQYRYYGFESSMWEMELEYHQTDKAEIESQLRDYEVMTDAVLSGTASKDNESAVVKQIYTWVGYNTSYVPNRRDQDMSSVFDTRSSVCAGYTQTLQFMCLRAGIPCVRIGGHSAKPDGSVSTENHTWVAIVLYGKLKYYDVTWDDLNGTSMSKYYEVSQQTIETTHAFESDAAPRNNSERDDSQAVIDATYYVSTGAPLGSR